MGNTEKTPMSFFSFRQIMERNGECGSPQGDTFESWPQMAGVATGRAQHSQPLSGVLDWPASAASVGAHDK